MPCSSKTLASGAFFATHSPAVLPSCSKSAPIHVAYGSWTDVSHGAVHQDDGDPGVLDLLQDLVPARLDDRGERDDVDVLGDEVAQRLDLVLLLLLASTNFRSIPLAAVSADFTDSVFAVRHPLSAPSWEKPTVMVSPPPPAAVSLPRVPPPAAVRPQRVATPNAATIWRRVVLGDDMGSSSSVVADCCVGAEIVSAHNSGVKRRRQRAGHGPTHARSTPAGRAAARTTRPGADETPSPAAARWRPPSAPGSRRAQGSQSGRPSSAAGRSAPNPRRRRNPRPTPHAVVHPGVGEGVQETEGELVVRGEDGRRQGNLVATAEERAPYRETRRGRPVPGTGSPGRTPACSSASCQPRSRARASSHTDGPRTCSTSRWPRSRR